jgi:hypothetical protein
MFGHTGRVGRFFVLTCLSGTGVAFADLPNLASPLHATGLHAGGIGVELAVDGTALESLRALDAARLVDFPLNGQSVSIDVRRVEPFAADARIVVMTDAGEVVVPVPDLLVVSGSVVGHEGSTAILSFAPSGVNGLIDLDNRQFVISSGPSLDGSSAVEIELTAASAAALNLQSHGCGIDALMAQAPGRLAQRPAGGETRGSPPCRLATIAIETDEEYLAHFGGSVSAASAYAGTLIGGVSEIYARDFNAHLQIGFLRIWQTTDPWTTDDAIDQIFQFQDYWNANMTGVFRHAAHFLSPRTMSSAGGVAYLPGLCQTDYDYGLSAYLNGFFPYPIVHNDSQNWDLMVAAHELGHNFGAPHTHDMTPPVDGCAFGDCSVVPNGTIMSYCHTCAGGMANIRMEFHPRTLSEGILPYLATDAPCNIELQAVNITQQPAGATACPGSPVSLSVTATGGGTLSYQWQRNGGDIAGATSATYSIASYVPATDGGTYSVHVSNACGEVVSNGAVLGTCTSPLNDIDANCTVDIGDLAILLSNFGMASGATYADGDLNGDGGVDLTDLATMLSSFGSTGC